MEFYQKRSSYEQSQRLPAKYRYDYLNSQIDRIEIDGCEICGYFEYSFMEEKSYNEQPVRSQNGEIVEIDSYSSFLTPRLIIKYNMMGIEDYRKLMTFLQSKNSFLVTCYDEVADRRVTHEMYFAPPSMPIIYQKYLAVLGVQEYSIELIGTNRRINNNDFKLKIYTSESHTQYEEFNVYEDDTWLSFVLSGNTEYKIKYEKTRSKFIVTKDDGITAIGFTDEYNKVFVQPHDKISQFLDYEMYEVSRL